MVSVALELHHASCWGGALWVPPWLVALSCKSGSSYVARCGLGSSHWLGGLSLLPYRMAPLMPLATGLQVSLAGVIVAKPRWWSSCPS